MLLPLRSLPELCSVAELSHNTDKHACPSLPSSCTLLTGRTRASL
uniref:Uncharacterized protein n=1 Tax=Anguilla anguilla TaxID=7936 RepID=A0A0E9TVW9_ANGAN